MPIDKEQSSAILFRQQFLRRNKFVKTNSGEVGMITYQDSEYLDLHNGHEEITYMKRDISNQAPKLREKIRWYEQYVLTALINALD